MVLRKLTLTDETGHRIIRDVPERNNPERSFSWLEYLPVTQGVAGSSPVRSATLRRHAIF